MNEDDKIIARGPFKGKRIVFAPTTRMDKFWEIAEDFIKPSVKPRHSWRGYKDVGP